MSSKIDTEYESTASRPSLYTLPATYEQLLQNYETLFTPTINVRTTISSSPTADFTDYLQPVDYSTDFNTSPSYSELIVNSNTADEDSRDCLAIIDDHKHITIIAKDSAYCHGTCNY
jgi:hypothetical protein